MFVDFEAVKKTYKIEDVAFRLGLQLKPKNNQLRGPCPSGGGDERSLVITPAKGVWYSFAEQKGGDLIALVSFVKGYDPKDAANWIVSDTVNTVPTVPAEGKTEAKPRGGFKPLDYLEAEHPAVEALGIDSNIAKVLGWGFAPRGMLKGTVAIAIRDSSGVLAGYIGITDAVLPPKWEVSHE